MLRLNFIEADITKLEVDVIVNAANEAMLGGGGVDGAIHRAAGPGLYNACFAFPNENGVRLPTGQARITPAFNLPSKFIVHTAGPIWNGGDNNEEGLLSACYLNSLMLASLHGKSVAFPAISTGIFGYPIDRACKIAIQTVKTFDIYYKIDRVILVTFKSPEVTNCFRAMGIQEGDG
jgi:O-acetyl-ADP-ribose deacetylase (regulator of RNase III)